MIIQLKTRLKALIPKLLETRPKFALVYGFPAMWGANRVAKKIRNIPKSRGLWYRMKRSVILGSLVV